MPRARARRQTQQLLLGLLAACGGESAGDAADVSTMSAVAPGGAESSAAGSSNSKPGGAAGSGNPGSTTTQRAAAGSAAGSPTAGAASKQEPATQTPPDLTPLGAGDCCPDGKCLCRAEPPAVLNGDKGAHTSTMYELADVGCVYYPGDAPPPYAAVAVADGFGGGGGCDSVQTGEWGPLYASHGIVALIIEVGTGDQPSARAAALLKAIATFKAENEKSDSPLFGKLAGRYGTSGFSLGGSGSTLAGQTDTTLLSNVVIMPLGQAAGGTSVPTLIVCGDSDGIAPCASYGASAYAEIAAPNKMRATLASPHNGQPSAASGASGGLVLAFQKLFLEGDERWRPLLTGAKADETTIE
jgi:hypothetical protein